jgi:hypothetical protein
MKKIAILVFCFLCLPKLQPPAEASELAALQAQVSELTQMVKTLTTTVERQGAELAELRSVRVPGPAAPSAARPGVDRSILGRWNPDIGVIADTVLTLDSPKEDEEGADRIAVRELELVFGSAVDPYSRLDVTLAISDFEEMGLEEAYYTHFGLPFGATGRVGRFKPIVGKAIPIHRDSLDTVDEPLVVQRWFGIEGYNKSGADLKMPLDLPWPVAHELAIGVLEGGNGEDGTAFGEARRHPTLYAHLKNYLDLNDSTGVEVGLNYLAGSKDDDGQFEVNILGLDGTLIHHLNANQRVKLQAEGYFMERGDGFIDEEDPDTLESTNTEFDDTLWGTYVLADFRFGPQWATGFRFDYVDLVDTAVESVSPDGDLLDNGSDEAYTGYLTFYQSEFARWRAQFTRVEQADGEHNNIFLLQGTFAIGEHKHKLQ